jgi:hypothetical protein
MTSIEWLQSKLPSLFENDDNGFYAEIFAKAKEIHKQQIIDAYGDGLNAHRTDFCNRDEYFAKTYGSEGSDTPHVTPQVTPQVTSQTEISDEEIEKAAKECTFEDLDISVGSFELGAKWYREQLKQRQ